MVSGMKTPFGKGSLFAQSPNSKNTMCCVICLVLPNEPRDTNSPHEKGALETHVSFLPCQELKMVVPILEWEPTLKFSGAPQIQPSSKSCVSKRLGRTKQALWQVT